MGRTSKFTFPVPGRKPKATSIPSISAPLTKAQKILGTGEINIDSPTLPKDPSRWETNSSSGMSVTISESTASYASETGLGILSEGEVVNGVSRGRRWENESEIIPSAERFRGAPADALTDASSLRRRESTSTIVSYYDKSKLPLSISQQTSSSAMAKGLPQKANAVLDIDGTAASESAKAQKKKPAMLDLSYLLPKSRKKHHSELYKDLVLGPDLVTKSPSLMTKSPSEVSMSPEVGRPSFIQRSERRLRKKTTKESLRSPRQAPQPDLLSPPPSGIGLPRGKRSGVDLNNLYEHYEQRTFRDVMGGQDLQDHATGRSIPAFPTPPPSSSTRGFLTPFSTSAGRTPYSHKSSSNSNLGGPETPITAILSPKSVISPPADCAASISSRNTRTSKASKRTDRSMTDYDLQQNSILSLSSDSEEEFRESRPRTSLSMPGSSAAEDPSGPASPQRGSGGDRPTTGGAQRGKRAVKRTSFAPSSQYLTIPDNNKNNNTPVNPVKPPAINTRTSSLSLNSTSSVTTVIKAPTLSDRSTSRLSLRSNSTVNSIGPLPRHAQVRQRAHEAKAITMIPANGNHPQSIHSPQRAASRLSRSSDHPTPPLSPTSVDFYLQSQHTSLMDPDIGSIRSGRSLPTISEARQLSSPAGSNKGSDGGRLMAVTRQEEMLLAALRIKRARMRETIIAEFEEEQERGFEDILQHGEGSSGGEEQTTPSHAHKSSTGSSPPRRTATHAQLHSRHGSGTGTATTAFRKTPSQSTIGTVVGRESQESLTFGIGTAQRHQAQQGAHKPGLSVNTGATTMNMAPTSARSEPLASAPASTPTMRTAVAPGAAGTRRERDRILLYLDRPSAAVIDASEPSPDLSDFMVFDDGSEEFPLQTPSSDGGRRGSGGSGSAADSQRANTTRVRSPAAALAAVGGARFLNPVPASKKAAYRRGEAVEPASPRSSSGLRRGRDDVHVRIVEDGVVGVGDEGVDGEEGESDAGIPRPDSPLSSVAPVLPRKKAVRLSAVGRVGVEAGWWGHDG